MEGGEQEGTEQGIITHDTKVHMTERTKRFENPHIEGNSFSKFSRTQAGIMR